MTLQPLTRDAPDLPGRVVFRQRWDDLAMLHWSVDPDEVAALLPRGTHPDLHEGKTYVGLVPFTMRDVGIYGTPPLPYLSTFVEVNVRLYAVDDEGRRGVVFLSLEADRLLPVAAARIGYHLPYFWSRASATAVGDLRTWTTTRRWPGPKGAQSKLALRVGDRLEDDPLTTFLTARWGLFSTWYGRSTAWAPVWHPAWELHTGEVVHLDDELVSVGGLTVSDDPHVLWSPGVDVRFGRPLRLPQPGQP